MPHIETLDMNMATLRNKCSIKSLEMHRKVLRKAISTLLSKKYGSNDK